MDIRDDEKMSSVRATETIDGQERRELFQNSILI